VGTAASGAFSDNVFALRLDSNGRPRIALYPGTGDGGGLPPNRLHYLTCDADCLQTDQWTALDIGVYDYGGEGGVTR